VIISRTPFRVSFLGGGTDLPAFYTEHDGAVLSAAINKYMYLTLHPTFDQSTSIIKYSEVEVVSSTSEIIHPIVRAVFQKHGIFGFDISSSPDIPSGTGLGSSSAYTVGLCNLIARLKGIKLTPAELAEEACSIEIEYLNQPIGKQDQYASTFGGFNAIKFLKNGLVEVNPLQGDSKFVEYINTSMFLVRVGMPRSATELISNQLSHGKEMNSALKDIFDICIEGTNSVLEKGISALPTYVNASWQIKKTVTSQLADSEVDFVIALALRNGALGAKLLGAGESGFILIIAERESAVKLRDALSPRKIVDFELDTIGSKIVYHD
jgi:D-glycero-alpha-D-manno-heptose-7-phosphate kinase